jgi:hypothetical protein
MLNLLRMTAAPMLAVAITSAAAAGATGATGETGATGAEPGPVHAVRGRFFQAEPGYVRAKDLPEDFRTRIDTVRFAVKDAFEGVDIHTALERWAYDVLDQIHIESREGTIRQRLLFSEGSEVGKGELLESEKSLRDEQFLADAVIEVGPDRNGSRTIKVTTYDQWTTSPIVSAALVKGDLFTDVFLGRWGDLSRQEWLYGFGLWESNVLGTGTRLGGSYRHDLERNTLEAMLNNQSFSRYKLQGTLYAADLSDGHSYLASLAMPLRSRDSRWGFDASVSSLEWAERVYFDANRLDELPPGLRDAKIGESHIHREYEGVTHDSLFLSVTRSYGHDLKLNVSPTLFIQDRYQREGRSRRGGAGDDADTALMAAAPLPASADGPELGTDALAGVSVSIGQYAYRTARNFRNLKWNETVETGWRLTTRVLLNQEWLGADNSDLRLGHAAAYGESWRDRWYASCSLSTAYFLDPRRGKFEDGQVDASFETQWKPIPLTASVLTGAWSNFFATPRSRQITLGAFDGLAGYPSFYYSGQARLLLIGEQRLFPEFEVLTMVPAFTLFLAAGNTFPTYGDFDPGNLHYSTGLGIKIGRSKSPTKSVQHISVSWPIGEKGLPGLAVSISAKRSL